MSKKKAEVTPETEGAPETESAPPVEVTKEKPVQVPKDIQNNVVRPKAGTTCGRVWEICNMLSEQTNAPAEHAKVIELTTVEGINSATAATQHGKWRRYHGLTAAVKTPEEKAAKEQAKADAKALKKAAADEKKAAKEQAKAAKEAAKQQAAAIVTPPSPDITTEPVA